MPREFHIYGADLLMRCRHRDRAPAARCVVLHGVRQAVRIRRLIVVHAFRGLCEYTIRSRLGSRRLISANKNTLVLAPRSTDAFRGRQQS